MTKIIGISGRKQSGKNTIANYINGYVLKSMDMVQEFSIDEDGLLNVKTSDSEGHNGWGILDLLRKDETFVNYADRELWPYIKIYHFADYLKEMCVDLFDLKPENVYGTDEQKNSDTHFMWENMPTVVGKTGPLTHREFLEYFGTAIIRKIKFDTWSSFTLKKILREQSSIAIIPDVRFPNEVKAIQDNGGIVVRLTRDVFNSKAEAESALDADRFNWDNFDIVIDNHNMTMDDLWNHLNKNNFWS